MKNFMSLAFLGLNKVFEKLGKHHSNRSAVTQIKNDIYSMHFLKDNISTFSIIRKCSNSLLKPYKIDNQSVVFEKFIYFDTHGVFTFVEKRKNNQSYTHIMNFFSSDSNRNFKIFLDKQNNQFVIKEQKIDQASYNKSDFSMELNNSKFYECLNNLNNQLIEVEKDYQQDKTNKELLKKNKNQNPAL